MSELLPFLPAKLLVSFATQVLLSDPLYLPSGAVPKILPWDPASFVAELQPRHQEDLWDREDVTHGRVALSLGEWGERSTE